MVPSRTRLPRVGSAVVHAALAIVAAWIAAAPMAVHAQGAEDEVPGRVGRVANFQGSLYLAPQDRASEWAEIGLNYPVAGGDNLWMSGDGRAEIDYGSGQFRVGADSNVHVSRLDDRTFALFVAQGRVIVRVRALEAGESAVIDTPNAQVELVRPGLYRIDVSPEPRQTWLIVREGEANVVLPSGLQQVLPGQTATIAGADGGVAEVRNGVSVDGLDTWSADRDRVYGRGRPSTAYVSSDMVGHADLDAYGAWQTYPEYGPVWFPTAVVDDWAPYRYGRWAWLGSYGWTWVDDAPWGYAPFHYGRWAYVGGRWGWCPGAYVRHPVWAPALVAWYGGSNWRYSASVGGPVFGWVPLGWREPFVPWWGRCSSRCYERYNRPYAVNLAERPHRPVTSYVNAAVPGAITAVPGAAMRETRPVQSSRVTLPPTAVASAPVLGGAPQVRPVVSAPNVVRPGRGAPVPAGDIAARVKPMAIAPAARSDAGYVRPRVIPAPGTTAVGPAQRSVTPAPPAAPPAGAPVGAAPPRGAGQVRVAPATTGTPAPQTRVAPFDGSPLPQTRAAPNVAPTSSVAPPAAQAPMTRAAPREYVERPARMAPAPSGPAPVPATGSRVTSAPPAHAPLAPPVPMQHAQPVPPIQHVQPPPPPPPPPQNAAREPRGEKPAPPNAPRGPGANQN
jgi:hypothetical protein